MLKELLLPKHSLNSRANPERLQILPRDFYSHNPATVAEDLLGKTLVRRLDSEVIVGRIVETEAYFGIKDPASRAHIGRKTHNEPMFLESGRTFIYMVHANWLLNIVAHPNGSVGGVLLRAVEPLQGIEIMLRNRRVRDIRDLTNGPGKLATAFAVTKALKGVDVTDEKSQLVIMGGAKNQFEIESSHRIGVTADLPQKLRFYVKGNMFISR